MLLVIFVLVLEFIILRVLPIAIYGFDPAIMIVKQAEQQAARKADIDEFIQSFKLDKPLFPDQFISYFVKILAFDFGISFRTRTPVAEEILERIPNTVILLGTSLIISIVLGFILGTYAATNKGKRSDQALVLIGMMSYAIPSYILGILLLMGLAYMPKILWGITLFPLGGSTVVLKEINIAGISFNMFNPEYLWYMTLPLLALVIASFGAWAYYVRQLVMVELGQEYIVTARATTAVALNIPFILSGAIIIETIFSWHGLGRYIYDSVVNYDYPAIQAVLYIVAVITAISLFIADIIIYKLDPRVKS